ncbi:DUF6233 domain-containing protein [Streptomyces sp. NPDC032472]|uniref:DUF6233 domain-containing protein n=1 Tax=Streptomyces sp. NPDC032472 TaxID=3155018 RepID=UPI00340F9C8C
MRNSFKVTVHATTRHRATPPENEPRKTNEALPRHVTPQPHPPQKTGNRAGTALRAPATRLGVVDGPHRCAPVADGRRRRRRAGGVRNVGDLRAAAPDPRCGPGRRAHPPSADVTASAGRWAWLLDGRTSGRAATIHAEGCRLATDRARPLTTMRALDALARPGTAACTGCDAAEVLLPILRHGQDEGREEANQPH